jgi:hypothetical protein
VFRRTARGQLIPAVPPVTTRPRRTKERGIWVKSSFSAAGDCVEWYIDDRCVKVRDSKYPAGPTLVFTHSEWDAFRRGMQAGEGAL